MPKQIFIIILLCLITKGYSQLDESILSFDYRLSPMVSDDFDFSKTSVKINIPIKLNKGTLTNSLTFDDYQFNYQNTIPFITDDLNEFYNFNYGLLYRYPINKKWNVVGEIGISAASNFTDSFNSKDLLFNSQFFVVKKGGTKDKPSYFKLGADYSTVSGSQRILPLISYTKKVSDKFSYQIGFPSSFTKYHINERSSLKSLFEMNGFYANLSNSVVIDTSKESTKVSFTEMSLGLEYEYWMDDFWAVTFKTGYAICNKYKLEDANKNTVYDFEANSKPYFSTGVKFSLIKIFNNKNNDDK